MADYSSGELGSTTSPFTSVKNHWKEKLCKAIEYKGKHFDKDANEIRKFLKGGADLQKHLYGTDGTVSGGDFSINHNSTLEAAAPDMLMTTNRTEEVLAVMGPHLYHRNPHRQVNPRKQPEMPQELFMRPPPPEIQQQIQMLPPEQQEQITQQMQQQQEQQYAQYVQSVSQSDGTDAARATLLAGYLNYTPTPLHLRDEMRLCTNETLTSGLGVMVSEVYRPTGSKSIMFGSFNEHTDHFVIEPDMERIDLAKVVWRRKIRPVWEVENEFTIPYGFPRGYLKGNTSSSNQDAATGKYGIDAFHVKQGIANDLLVYWECYSKMGLGAKLAGVQPELRDALDQFGDNVLLVICDTCKVPINLLGAKDGEDLQRRMRWPTPYWRDDTWPFTFFQFRPQSRCVYPYSIIRPALGELKFLNWCYSFLASKVKLNSTDYMVTLKTAGEELKKALREGGALKHINLSQADGSLKASEVIQMIQHLPMNRDILDVLALIEEQFERRTGLTPLLYGAGTQSRLASDADFRQQRSMVRVDDMADMVEEGATQMARKEGLGARYHLDAMRDIAPVLGQQAAMFWQQIVTPAEIDDLLRQMEYRIEAGSIRKPNAERDQTNMATSVQTLGPILQQREQMTGDFGPLNALMEDWAKAHQVDGKRYKATPPPPDEGPSPEEQAAQLEMQKMQMEMQISQQQSEADMQAKMMDLQIKQQEAEMDFAGTQQSFAMDAAQSQQDMAQDAQQHTQEMEQSDKQFAQEMRQLVAKQQLEVQMMRTKQAIAKKQAAQKAKAKPKAVAK